MKRLPFLLMILTIFFLDSKAHAWFGDKKKVSEPLHISKELEVERGNYEVISFKADPEEVKKELSKDPYNVKLLDKVDSYIKTQEAKNAMSEVVKNFAPQKIQFKYVVRLRYATTAVVTPVIVGEKGEALCSQMDIYDFERENYTFPGRWTPNKPKDFADRIKRAGEDLLDCMKREDQKTRAKTEAKVNERLKDYSHNEAQPEEKLLEEPVGGQQPSPDRHGSK